MKKSLICLSLIAFAICSVFALYAGDKIYLMKGNKIVECIDAALVDYITFDKPTDVPTYKVKITTQANDYCTVKADKSTAIAGETVKVTATMTNYLLRLDQLMVNGEVLEPVSENGMTTNYEFEMPEENANITIKTVMNYHLITRKWDSHSEIVMCDCIENQGTAAEFCQQTPSLMVHFRWVNDLGYDATVTVTGDETGKSYDYQWYEANDETNQLGYACWGFVMPNEPVTIEVTTVQNTTYQGEDFVALYRGCGVNAYNGRLISSSNPEFSIDLQGNGAYTVKSTDASKYNYSGLYTCENNKFEYVQGSNDKFGVRGQVFGDYLFAYTLDLVDPKPDNVRFYMGSKRDVVFACASENNFATRAIVEMTPVSGVSSWFLVENQYYRATPLTATFTQGKSIKDANAEAMFALDGENYIKYTTDGTTPTLRFRGKECGTYTCTGADDLTVDGFGNATCGSIAGEYTYEGTIVTIVYNGIEYKYDINLENHTYTVVKRAEWDGAKEYYTDAAKAVYSGLNRENAIVKVLFDQNLVGAEKEGYAAIKISCLNDMGSWADFVGDCQPYYYDEAAGTVTITNVLQGSGTGWSTKRAEIVLNVSADKKTLTFAADKIYATSSYKNYLLGAENTVLSAVGEAVTAPAGHYSTTTADGSWLNMDVTGTCSLSLNIDEAADGTAKAGYAYIVATVPPKMNGANAGVIDDCKEYVYDATAKTLTIKGVTVGDLQGGSVFNDKSADVVFTVSDDLKTLTLNADLCCKYDSSLFNSAVILKGGATITQE